MGVVAPARDKQIHFSFSFFKLHYSGWAGSCFIPDFHSLPRARPERSRGPSGEIEFPVKAKRAPGRRPGASGAKRLTIGGWQLKPVNGVLLACWLFGGWQLAAVNRIRLPASGVSGRLSPAAGRSEPTGINRFVLVDNACIGGLNRTL